MEISLLARTRGILERYNLRAQKKLSQNFLISEAALQKIVAAVDAQEGDLVLEVGAGLGVLTEEILKTGARVVSLELDSRLFSILQERLQAYPNLVLLHENILKFNPEPRFQKAKVKGVGNLPYHLSGAILRWFLDNRAYFSELHFMLQKEVAERIVSPPGPKAYGVLSVLCQGFTTPEISFSVPGEAFFPAPKVESAFIRMTPKPEPDFTPSIFTRLVKQSFGERRKTLFNNLKSWTILSASEWKALLAELCVDEKLRAEALPVSAYAAMAQALERMGKS